MTIKLRLEDRAGAHVTVVVFVGPDADHLGRAGLLTMRAEEWIGLVDPPDEGHVVVVKDGEVSVEYEICPPNGTPIYFDDADETTKPGGEL